MVHLLHRLYGVDTPDDVASVEWIAPSDSSVVTVNSYRRALSVRSVRRPHLSPVVGLAPSLSAQQYLIDLVFSESRFIRPLVLCQLIILSRWLLHLAISMTVSARLTLSFGYLENRVSQLCEIFHPYAAAVARSFSNEGTDTKHQSCWFFCVNKTEKTGGMWTNTNVYRENWALSDISREIFYVTIVLCLNILWLKAVSEVTARQTRTGLRKHDVVKGV